MNKKIAILIATITTLLTFQLSAENVKASVETGYTTDYMVNGVSRATDRAFTTIALGATYSTVDMYMGVTLLPTSTSLDESHWKVGLGRGVAVAEGVSLRFDAQAIRHLTSIVGQPNSTEFNVSLALENKLLTPYVRGISDIELKQTGYIIGVKRSTDVFGLFTLTPAIEYGRLTDYETFCAKATISRVIWKHLEPFVEVGYYDSNIKSSFAARNLSGKFTGGGGLKWTF